MSDVFLSYKSNSRNFAEDVRIRLISWGYTVWWDQDIKAGENFVSRIRQEIENAKAVVVNLSVDAVQPTESYVIAEAMYARLKKPIIPVVVPPLEAQNLPPPLNTLKSLRWADSEAIHVALKGYGIMPSEKPIPAQVFRQDVFTIGQPTYTEVDRSKLKEYQDLQANLRMKGRLVRLWGPTQTGKSVLAKMAFSGFMPIELEGRELRSLADFYDSIVIKYAPDIGSESRHLAINKYLMDSLRPIIIDDFHHVPVEVQTEIIEVAKILVRNDVNIVLISIPDCAAEILAGRAEFSNRSIAIKSPRWSGPQLRQIPKLGFEWLNVQVHPKVIDEIIWQAHGNPHLVQEFCYRLCEHRSIGVLKTFDKPTPIAVSKAVLTSIFKDVGAARNYELIPLLKELGATEDAARVKWAASQSAPFVSLPAIVLIVLDRKGAFAEVSANVIATFAQKLIRPRERRLISEESILTAGAALISALHAAGVPETVIGQNKDRFFIQHADFKVHLHWTLAPRLTHIQPQLEKLTQDYTIADVVAANT